MKARRTYVFTFVPILSDLLVNEESQCPALGRCEGELEELPSQLLWTWFVYDPPEAAAKHKEENTEY